MFINRLLQRHAIFDTPTGSLKSRYGLVPRRLDRLEVAQASALLLASHLTSLIGIVYRIRVYI